MKLIDQIDIQSHNVKWLYDLESKGLLEVDNSFQRNYVWIEKHQVKLIESIILGYPIPEIYLWNIGTDGETGDTQYSIIDGQQRWGAIFQFISNNFELRDRLLNPDNPQKDNLKGRHFKDLSEDDKKAIWSYPFSIRIVKNQVSKSSIVNMFLRLNSNNMTLNPQELRNAEFEGEFITLASELSELEFWDNHKIFSIADRRRMRDISIINGLLVFLKKGIEEGIGNANLNQIYDLYNKKYPGKEEDKKRFKGILENIDEIIDGRKERESILKRQVHFYSIFTVIYDITSSSKNLNEIQITNFRSFIDNYNDDENLFIHFEGLMEVVLKYKALAKEGTTQKNNRFQRHSSLKKIVNYNSL